VSPSEQQLSSRSMDAAARIGREGQESLGLGDTWGLSDVEVKNEDESFDFSDLMASLDATNQSKEVGMKDSARRTPPAVDFGREEGFVPYIDPRRSSSCIPGFFVEFKNDDEKKGDGDVKPRGGDGQRVGQGVGEGEGWEGEGYEKDKVLVLEGRKGVSQEGWQFIKKVQKVPDQCVRRSLWAKDVDIAKKQYFSDRPLWPHSDLPTPPSCPCCGSRRVFAVQLMAPMISAIAEAKEWLEEELGEEGETPGQLELETLPLSSGWATVAVYMCEQMCTPTNGGDYVEEEVAIGMED
jgi:hypothetical protein